MSNNQIKHDPRHAVTAVVFLAGLAAVAWVGAGYLGGRGLSNGLALAMTGLIAFVYLLGAHELYRYRQATGSLAQALADIPQPLLDLPAWLGRIHPGLQHPVRLRIEGERAALPGPALTPYLVGLLVMLGMLGTFLGMVVTFKGAVFALEGSADLGAIRAALAEPIKGLSLSFGTSVAGVAASAMLGLLSAIGRRERLEAVRRLDVCIGGVLRPYSASFQREETFRALQVQAQALPQIADRLQAMMDGLAQRSEQLGQHLRDQQAQFHGEAGTAYKALADSVARSLQESLGASARLAGETIQPVVETAMAGIRQAASQTHQQLIDATQAQLHGLSERWAETAQGVLTSVQVSAEQSHALLAQADAQRLAGWAQAMSAMSQSLVAEWQRAAAQTLAQQQAACDALQAAASQVTAHASGHVDQTLGAVTALLAQSEELVRSRAASEAQWLASQGERMTQLSGIWRSEMAALREQEAARAEAAVASLDALQAATAQHLAALGASLEAPMTRLLQTASEVPQAAAGIITQLRQEMGRLSERDNRALAERTEMMAALGRLLGGLEEATQAQRSAVDALVDAATTVLAQAGQRFADALGTQAERAQEVADRVNASAVELASLGEAFHHGVGLFSASSEKLTGCLQGIEAAIGQSLTRSDEQLAYYVAQAREVIDLSISSQQGIVEDLRRLHARQPVAAAVAAGA